MRLRKETKTRFYRTLMGKYFQAVLYMIKHFCHIKFARVDDLNSKVLFPVASRCFSIKLKLKVSNDCIRGLFITACCD